MTADNLGNDLSLVNVPETGFMAWNPEATGPLTLADLDGAVPAGYTPLGLMTKDGGYAETTDGAEDEEYYQKGYKRAIGNESISFTSTLAECNEQTRLLEGWGEGTATQDVGITGRRMSIKFQGKVGFIVCTRMANGRIEVRAGMATITSVQRTQEERGASTKLSVTAKWERQYFETEGVTAHYLYRIFTD